ncbi:lysozyme inhibitor LprI family protein [Streptacidiphilus rugosus]|uniref:lysozyme inhibitor LprI family protein n=1 Tax=Streptacidiphilus rugosus TaxID=405783 RepID=UPI0012FCA2E8|nr:lysozyme inhibitor LprI family protein [Streptacidiphilus rugosus]
MSTDDLEAAYQAAEGELRAYYATTMAKYRGTLHGCDNQDPAEALAASERAWIEAEQEHLARLPLPGFGRGTRPPRRSGLVQPPPRRRLAGRFSPAVGWAGRLAAPGRSAQR